MFKSTQTLYDDLAKTLGVASLPADDDGSVELSIGDDTPVILFAVDSNGVLTECIGRGGDWFEHCLLDSKTSPARWVLTHGHDFVE